MNLGIDIRLGLELPSLSGFLLLLLGARGISPQPVALLFHGLQRLPRLFAEGLGGVLRDEVRDVVQFSRGDVLAGALRVLPQSSAVVVEFSSNLGPVPAHEAHGAGTGRVRAGWS